MDSAILSGDPSVSVFTVVLRAGRAGASMDHNSICFPVDAISGKLGQGKSNQVCVTSHHFRPNIAVLTAQTTLLMLEGHLFFRIRIFTPHLSCLVQL
jgi:hypothetical protein